MKINLLCMLALIVFSVNAQDKSNYVEKVKIAEEFKTTSVAIDAQDLSFLAKAADDWFYSSSAKNYLRVQSNNSRYEIDIAEIKADGYISAAWAQRYSTNETTILNHPYVISVMRANDNNGSPLTEYSMPNRKYSFHMGVTIGESGGVMLPPKPILNPVYLRFYHSNPTSSGYVTEYLNLDRIGANGQVTDNQANMLFATSEQTTAGVESVLTNNYGSNVVYWRYMVNALRSRFGGQLSNTERIMLASDNTPIFSGTFNSRCTVVNLTTNLEWSTFLNRNDLHDGLDGFYDQGDRAFLCSVDVNVWSQIRATRSYCAGPVEINDPRQVVYTNINEYTNPGHLALGRIKSSAFYNIPQNDWICSITNNRFIDCNNSAAVNCASPPPCDTTDPLGGCYCDIADPTSSCYVAGGGADCEMYLKDEWGGIPEPLANPYRIYAASCGSSIGGITVLDLAKEHSVGRCEIINTATPVHIECENFLYLFWDVDQDGVKDSGQGDTGFWTHNYSNATDEEAVDQAEGRYNRITLLQSEKAFDCTTQPMNTATPHESLCNKDIVIPDDSIRRIEVTEVTWSVMHCVDQNSPTCGAEPLESICRYEINNWNMGNNPIVLGYEGAVSCRVSAVDNVLIGCMRMISNLNAPIPSYTRISCPQIGSWKTFNWLIGSPSGQLFYADD